MPISQRNNNPIKLTKRLAAAASAVREACRVVDVGTDHGKLAAFLILEERCTFAYATDISEPSLKKAADLFYALGISSKTSAMVTDGLAGIDPKKVDDVVIAGLGADVAARIISDAPWLKDENKRLVLVPSSHHERLRRYLYANGFLIRFERAVFEGGIPYTVMSAQYCGLDLEISPIMASLGKILDSDGDKDAYLSSVRKRNQVLLLEMEKAKISDLRKIKEAREIVDYIDRITG